MARNTIDMSVVESTRQVNPLCVDYLHKNNYRRLKKQVAAPEAGSAAGLLPNARYHGRGTPLKGKGVPPPDNQEGTFTPSIRVNPAGPSASWAPHNVLAPAEPAILVEAARKPAVRQFNKVDAMKGSGAVVEQEVPTKRMARLPGKQHPEDHVENTTRRVMADAVPLGGPLKSWEVPRTNSLRTWVLPKRSPAADTIIHHHDAKTVVTDRPPKLDDGRVPAPSVNPPPPEAARAVFFAAASDYYVNKARGTLGSTYNVEA